VAEVAFDAEEEVAKVAAPVIPKSLWRNYMWHNKDGLTPSPHP